MRQSSEFRDDLARRTCLLINLDESIEVRKLLLTSFLESLAHFRSMLPVVPKNCAGVAQFVGSRDNQSGFRFPAPAVDLRRLPRLPFLLLLAVNFKAVTTASRYVGDLFCKSKVVSKPWQDFQSSHVPAVNRQLKSAGLTELHLEGALPASSQAKGNSE